MKESHFTEDSPRPIAGAGRQSNVVEGVVAPSNRCRQKLGGSGMSVNMNWVIIFQVGAVRDKANQIYVVVQQLK